jgi:hypothetical protein
MATWLSLPIILTCISQGLPCRQVAWGASGPPPALAVLLFLLFLQEIISERWFVRRGNPGETAASRETEQRISVHQTAVVEHAPLRS